MDHRIHPVSLRDTGKRFRRQSQNRWNVEFCKVVLYILLHNSRQPWPGSESIPDYRVFEEDLLVNLPATPGSHVQCTRITLPGYRVEASIIGWNLLSPLDLYPRSYPALSSFALLSCFN